MRLDQFIAQRGRSIALASGEALVRQGDCNPPSYYLQSGLLKACYLTSDGKEFIKSFIDADSLIGSVSSALAAEPSPFGLVALEECHLVRFSLRELQVEAAKDLELAKQVIERLIRVLAQKEQREREFLTLSPEERYVALKKERPSLFERVSQNDIARYLGVTPVGLSRIKGRLAKRRQPLGSAR